MPGQQRVLARIQAQMDASEEVTAVEAEFAESCKAVSTSVGTQLYYHEGT